VTARGPGRLIAFEGIDGCGKSTQAAILADRLDALLTHEPGGTALGAQLRGLLLQPGGSALSVRTEALLMAADRAQHVDEVVGPALRDGRWVVTDRYTGSTLAYQGYGRGIGGPELDALVAWATGGLVPDLTVLIEIPVQMAAARRADKDGDRFEDEGSAFLSRVADGYRRLAEDSPATWLVVDGTGPVEEVAAAVWAGVARLGPPEADGD
jgi:dTMP kinase